MRSRLPLVALGVLAACGWRAADEQVLRQFFERSRVYDTTQLAPIATVTFNPTVEGIVERFDIVERTDEPQSDGGVRRQARLRVVVWSNAGRSSQRTLVVTLESGREGRWKVTRFRWAT